MAENENVTVETEETADAQAGMDVSSADLEKIVADITDLTVRVRKMNEYLLDAVMGITWVKHHQNYYNGLRTLFRGAGPFAKLRSYSWLSNPQKRAEFLKTENGMSAKDKNKFCALYDAAAKATELNNDVIGGFFQQVDDGILGIYKLARLLDAMEDVVEPKDLLSIWKSYQEFQIYISNVTTVSVRKGLSLKSDDEEVNRAKVRRDLSIHFPNLSRIITGPGEVAPGALNVLIAIDRINSQYAEVREYKDNLIDCTSKCPEYLDKAAKLEVVAGTYEFMDLYTELYNYINYLYEMLKKVYKAYNLLETGAEMPYAMIAYPDDVPAVVSKYKLGSCGDPKKEGTRYSEHFTNMARLLSEAVFDATRKNIVL